MSHSERTQPSPSLTKVVSHPLAQRQNSSGDSYETGRSDPKDWFREANLKPAFVFDGDAADRIRRLKLRFTNQTRTRRPKTPSSHRPQTQRSLTASSSSAGDYRSVIDDQAVEIQKLKELLKHYQQDGPGPLRKDKLFELKIHGLSKEGKRELEAMLHNFAAAVGGSSSSSSSRFRRGSLKGYGLESHTSADTSERGPNTVNANSSNNPPSDNSMHMSCLPNSIHYKPFIVQQTTHNGRTSASANLSPSIHRGDNDLGDWQRDLSVFTALSGRKRRHNGAIIFYNDAPFFTDLSRDPRGPSPLTKNSLTSVFRQGSPSRIDRCRPLSDMVHEIDTGSTTNRDCGDDAPIWLVAASNGESRSNRFIEQTPLEPCGIGGVWPDDHFIVRVITKHSNETSELFYPSLRKREQSKTTKDIDHRLPTSFTMPHMFVGCASSIVGTEYLSSSVEHMAPVSLPPPINFCSRFSSGMSDSDSDFEWQDDDGEYRANSGRY